MVVETATEVVHIEIERTLLDLQAQLRAAALKRAALAERSGKAVRLLIAVPDARRIRAVLDDHRLLLENQFPIGNRRLWGALRAGSPIGGDGLLFVRQRAVGLPRGPRRGATHPLPHKVSSGRQ